MPAPDHASGVAFGFRERPTRAASLATEPPRNSGCFSHRHNPSAKRDRLRVLSRPMSPDLPSTVPEVIGRLEAIEASASKSDGVVCFARLYRMVTEGVRTQLASKDFADVVFMDRLDVCFAGLFFSALDAFEREPTRAPSAWTPLFTQRSQRGIAPLQFALAGMNAHINRDLPVALGTTCEALHRDLREGSPEHGDFEQINALLGQVESRVKSAYMPGWLGRLDRLVHRFHRIDDVVAMWDVGRARDAAWTNGQALWALRNEPPLASRFLLALDRMVGLASRGLLLPADSLAQRLGRLLR